MISPELIRRSPFFANLEDKDLDALAMVANVVSYQPGETIYTNDQTSHEIFILLAGSVELFTPVEGKQGLVREFVLGQVGEQEAFGLSSLSAPFTHSSTARAITPTYVVRIDAQKLRWEIDADYRLGYIIMSNATRVLLDRLQHTRLQLARTMDSIQPEASTADSAPALFWFRPI